MKFKNQNNINTSSNFRILVLVYMHVPLQDDLIVIPLMCIMIEILFVSLLVEKWPKLSLNSQGQGPCCLDLQSLEAAGTPRLGR